MRDKKILQVSFIIIISSIIICVLSYFNPSYSIAILSSFILLICVILIIFLAVEIFSGKSHTTIDMGEITDIVENLNTEIVLWTDDCSAVFLNKKLRNILGIHSGYFNKSEIIKEIFSITKADKSSIKKIIDGENNKSEFLDVNGNKQYIVWSTSLIRQNKHCALYFSSGFNITEKNKIEQKLYETYDRHKLAMELSEIGFLMSQEPGIYTASDELVRMLGLKGNKISFNEFRRMIHPNERAAYDSSIKKVSSPTNYNGEILNVELRLKSYDGTYRWYSYRFKGIKTPDPSAPVIGGTFLDITHEREKDMLIEKLAYIDEITEIANRNKLVKIGQETYECCQNLDYSFWIIVVDIDKFHIINDSCGYEIGNKLLRNFAHNLYKYISLGGLAARISGDNFALMIRDYGDDDLPRKTVESIQRDFADMAVHELSCHSLTCSAGYSKLPDDGESFVDILEHAEFALKSGNETRSSITGYESNMHDAIIGDNELEKALSDAIDNNELHLFYQPKIEISTGKFIGVEALVRWIKPDGTIVPPSSFVPIAESSHLIDRISDFVLNEACNQNMMWQRMGYPKIIMSINFTSYDFYQKNLNDRVFEALVRSGLSAECLEVELTERLALHDIDYAVSQMNQLRDLGVRLAMDDFGTGYSSLSYIQILPLTLLKLDRSFVVNIESDHIAYEIVSAVIKIAKSKKIEVIAEGIETPRQAIILREAGCDYAQGYLYGKPMPADKIEEYFEQNEKHRQIF